VPRLDPEEIRMFPDFEIHPIESRIRMIFRKSELVAIEPYALAVRALVDLDREELGGLQFVARCRTELHTIFRLYR
jgi:hypothetical protein